MLDDFGSVTRITTIAKQAMGLTDGKYTPWIFEPIRNRQEVLDWLEAVAAGENPQTVSDRLKTADRKRQEATR